MSELSVETRSAQSVSAAKGRGFQMQFWNHLVEVRVHCFYLREYHVASDRTETRLNCFLALCSSTSIAAWAIWQQVPLLWAGIIGLSHVLSAVRQFLPFKKRADGVLSAYRELQEAALWAEQEWYAVSEGQLETKSIHDLTCELRKKEAKTDSTHLSPLPLPYNQILFSRAQEQAITYFQTHYPAHQEETHE